jgi:hypothetical protein
MFQIGDRVKIVATVFQEAVGTVVKVVPGRVRLIPKEFVVQTEGGLHKFFEDQLVLISVALAVPEGELIMSDGD